MKLRNYQQAAIDAVYQHLRTREDNPCVVIPTGCHQNGHPILMYDGSIKTVEEVGVGDSIMGPDSTPRIVSQLCRGTAEMFRITPTKGEPFVVNGNHMLSLACTNEGKPFPSSRRGGEIENISVRGFMSRSKSWKHLRKLYRVAVDFPNRPCLPIPPYILGLLLGDGCFCDVVSLTTKDEVIAKIWRDYVESTGSEINVADHGGRCPTYHACCGRGKTHLIAECLKQLELYDRRSELKFIPDGYRTASRVDRLELMAGLMDSDGSRHRTGFDYITASRELACDIVFLARSLGFAAYVRRKFCVCQTGAGNWYFRVGISGDTSAVPTRLDRKRTPRRRQKKSILRTGFEIEAAGKDTFYGFVLDKDHLYVDGNFVVHHNSGKTPIIAQLCRDAVEQWNGRVLVLAHVKELLEQSAQTLRTIAPSLQVGVYSAGLGRRDTSGSVIIAGIQSIYKRACELDAFDLIIVDEAHLLPPDGEGMYQSFLADARIVNPTVRLIGLTATPYRLKSGMLCTPDNLLNKICFEIGVKELILQGYLCALKSKSGRKKAEYGNLHLRAGEFINSEVEALVDTEELVNAACREIATTTKDRNAVLIFASSVAHAEHVQATLETIVGTECGLITGDTPTGPQDELINRFKGQRIAANLFGDPKPPLKYLINVNVLTTGFDAPNVDCVVLLRPTASPGLYLQMVGRGFRLYPGKSDCLVLDFGDNIIRHGPVDAIQIAERNSSTGTAPAKECPKCQSVIHAAYTSCPDCGFEFPPPERIQHNSQASDEGILSGEVTETEYEVHDVYYNVHDKKNANEGDPRTMRVDYQVGLDHWQSEWVCIEHSGYAQQKARAWWKLRSRDPFPDSARHGVEIADGGGLAFPLKIRVRSVAGEKFDRIVSYELADIPEPVGQELLSEAKATSNMETNPFGDYQYHSDEIPF